MKLFKLKTEFWGKDLNQKAELGYVVASSEEEVADHISKKYHMGYWFDPHEEEDEEYTEQRRQDILANKGDFHTEYDGEFYDQKYGWEEVGEITDDQLANLRALNIVPESNVLT